MPAGPIAGGTDDIVESFKQAEARELLDDCGRSRADFSWDEDERAIWVHGDDVDPEGVAGVVRVAIRRFEPGLIPASGETDSLVNPALPSL